MRTTPRPPSRIRRLCLALVAMLTPGTFGCAHQQLTNTDVALGVVAAGVVVGAMVLSGTHCNELTSQCQSGEATTGHLPPPTPMQGGFPTLPGR